MTNIYASSKNNQLMESLEIDYLQAPIWVNANVNGTSNVSYGVSSLVDGGTGLIGVNFIFARDTQDFCAIVNNQESGTQLRAANQNTANLSTTRSDFYNGTNTSPNTKADPVIWNIFIIGNNAA